MNDIQFKIAVTVFVVLVGTGRYLAESKGVEEEPTPVTIWPSVETNTFEAGQAVNPTIEVSTPPPYCLIWVGTQVIQSTDCSKPPSAQVLTDEQIEELKQLPQVLIRTYIRGLVVQAKKPEHKAGVELDYYTGGPEQVWYERKQGDRSIFINKAGIGRNRSLVLDSSTTNKNVYIYGEHGGKHQLWLFDSKDKTVSEANSRYLQVSDGLYAPGTELLAREKSNRPNQKFYIQYL